MDGSSFNGLAPGTVTHSAADSTAFQESQKFFLAQFGIPQDLPQEASADDRTRMNGHRDHSSIRMSEPEMAPPLAHSMKTDLFQHPNDLGRCDSRQAHHARMTFCTPTNSGNSSMASG